MYIGYSGFGADVIHFLKPFFLRNNTLCELDIDGRFGRLDEAIVALSEGLGSFSALRKFTFDSGDRLDRIGTGSIIRALSCHPNLKIMILARSKVAAGDGMTSLVALLKKPDCPLEEIKFGDSSLDDASAVEFAAGLGGNNSLKNLHLTCNDDITAKGWGEIFAQLQSSTLTLEKLVLTCNKFDDATAKSLGRALMNGTSLKGLQLSNNRTITAEGWNAIFRALPHCSRLEELSIGCQVRQAFALINSYIVRCSYC